MPRLNMRKTHKLGMAAVLGLEGYTRTRLPSELNELIKLRASLLNGCQFCIAMHSEDLRRAGETQERLAALEQDDPGELFDPRERAALALTDAVTRLGEGGVSDDVWDRAGEFFSSTQLGDLVLAIATINVWNRIGIATRLEA